MTRIFDALKKAQAAQPIGPVPTPGHPAPTPVHPAPPPPPAPVPITHPPLHAAPPPPTPLPRPATQAAWPATGAWVEQVVAAPLSEDLARELTTLRIAIEAGIDEREGRTVMFMSSQGGEGTSTLAAQFAALLAADGRLRVLLLDTHLRRPAPNLEGPAGSGANGAEGSPLAVLRLPAEIEARGVLVPATLRDLLGGLAASYDWVILGGPPVIESPEAAELACLADGVVVVVLAGTTKRQVVARATELLRKAGARVLGSVLNRRRLEIPEFLYRRL
jgi:Mrp family chromosome partitioning ATPase